MREREGGRGRGEVMGGGGRIGERMNWRGRDDF